eukprot:TRINITY_DN20977_c0_g7_i1.p1 TRINITY_DN20977_c0_g7~~TRINITY_DN20977_c0_g7_i1.p1  ORF type:complete len:1876 (-),score=399.26 TRINITY_DN20977_c0_g7_i1:171-5684(-)
MVNELFSRLAANYVDFVVSCQYLEIYMEKVRDLFNPPRARNPWDAPGPKLTVRFDGRRCSVDNATRLTFGNDAAQRAGCKGNDELAEMLSGKLLRDIEAAGRHRVVRGHALNAESSRSHAVLILEVSAGKQQQKQKQDQQQRQSAGQHIASTLMLVDLAGSESLQKAQVEGVGKEEAKSINKSLFSLTRCIDAIASNQKVPFRESVLTKILTPALDGRSCLTLVAALRGGHPTETRETLKFTETALKVRVKPQQTSTEALGAVQEQAQDLQNEIRALRQEIEWLKQSGANSEALSSMLQEKEAALKMKVETLASLRREIRDQEAQLQEIQRELDVSKRAVERERAGRLRAEAELSLLQARLQDAEAAADEKRRGAEKAKASRERFASRTSALANDLGAAKERGSFEDALRTFAQLIRLLEEDISATLTEGAHYARSALAEDLHVLAGDLARCLREWPDVQVRLADLRLVSAELSAQAQAVLRLRASPAAATAGGGDEDSDLLRLQSCLDEIWRLSRLAVTTLVGCNDPRLVASGESAVTAAAPSSGEVGVEGSRSGGLKALLYRVALVLVAGALRWKHSSHIWQEHWTQFESSSASAAMLFNSTESSAGVLSGDRFDACWLTADAANVAMVSKQLDMVLACFRQYVEELFGSSSGLGFAASVKEVQDACLEILGSKAEKQAGLDVEGALGSEVVEQYRTTIAAAASPTANPEGALEAMREFSDEWQRISDSSQQATNGASDEVPDAAWDAERVSASLRRLHLSRICEESSLQRHLSMPPAAFLRDVVRYARYDSPVFEHLQEDEGSWHEAWSQSCPSNEQKRDFYIRVCASLRSSCKSWCVSDHLDVTALCNAIVQGTVAAPALLFLRWVCLAIEATAVEHIHVSEGPFAHVCIASKASTALSSWVYQLRKSIMKALMNRKLSRARELASEDLKSLSDTLDTLRVERDSYAAAQERWEVERGTLVHELHRARGERDSALSSIAAEHDAKMQELKEQIDSLMQRERKAVESLSALEEELRLARANDEHRAGALDTIRRQLAAAVGMLGVVNNTRESVAALEADEEMEDLFSCLETLLKSHVAALREFSGESAEKAAKFDLDAVFGYIKRSRATKRLREARSFAQGATEGDGSVDGNGDDASPDALDLAVDEECERLRIVLLALAEQHAAVGSARLDEERALTTYMRATLRRARARRDALALRTSQLEADLREAREKLQNAQDDQTSGTAKHQNDSTADSGDRDLLLSLARNLRAKQDEPDARLQTLSENSAEVRQLRASIEQSLGGVTMKVRRVRRIQNWHLEAEFYESIADQVEVRVPPATVQGLFIGANARLCELVAEEGIRSPQELGSACGPYGDAVHLARAPSDVRGFAGNGPGRLRTLLVCDVGPGRMLSVAGEEDTIASGLDLSGIRQLHRDGVHGFDSLFVPGASGRDTHGDVHAIYDSRSVLPRFIVDFDVQGLGEESDPVESAEVARLRAELTELKACKEGAQIAAIRDLCKRLAASSADNVDARLIDVTRQTDPSLWDRCAQRIVQAASDGPGLAPGLEVVMTRLERIISPASVRRFYEQGASLLYPEEASQLLLHSSKESGRVALHGFSLNTQGNQTSQRFGLGIYFSTGVATFGGCSIGNHKVLLCEVCLGRPMLAQAARPNLDLEAVRRAGFDSVHAPRDRFDACDEWIVYHADQALPMYLLHYDVQPRAVASQLLNEVASLEERKRLLDEQMANVLQELEEARRDAEATRLSLDERLAQQLVDEEQHMRSARRRSQENQEQLDREQATLLQELERARGGGDGTAAAAGESRTALVPAAAATGTGDGAVRRQSASQSRGFFGSLR